MSESFNKNRIKFTKLGVQRTFILKAEKILGFTEVKLAKKLKISPRTIKEWTKERITISKVAGDKISKWAKIPIPKNHKIIDWQLHYKKAGQMGAQAVLQRYGSVGGNKKYRKEKWKEWWEI